MKVYKGITIDTIDEISIAILSQYPFEAFEEKDNGTTIGYILSSDFTTAIEEDIKEIAKSRGFEIIIRDIEPQNWNAEWEANFSPVDVSQFCTIRADFHDIPDGFEHVILIQPKMAFGTGHHETTYMMIDTMSSLNFSGKKVLDYGCGTGILAIMAKKLGAGYTQAIDIEEESYINTLENAEKNSINLESVVHGSLADAVAEPFDIILANINRNVLLSSVLALKKRLKRKGQLLLSGILMEDLDKITSVYEAAGYTLLSKKEKGYWVCLLMTAE